MFLCCPISAASGSHFLLATNHSAFILTAFRRCEGNRQYRIIPALRLNHRSGGCGTASALPKCSIMSGCGTRIVLRGQKPLALCDRCPCFGSLFPPLAALTFAASSIICAFGLASAAPRSPYRHLELCGIAQDLLTQNPAIFVEIDDIFDVSDIPFYYTGRPLFAQGPCLCYNMFI